jgi:hypothetical protein
MLNRREFLSTAAVAAIPWASNRPILIPVRHVVDSRAKMRPGQNDTFWSRIWPEAVRDFGRCGIQFQTSRTSGEVRRSPSNQPLFVGLERSIVNIVLTDHLPMAWDRGRGLSGVTTRYQGYHLCVVALNLAHGHEIPFLSLNTCVHELLHVLLHDIFESRPKAFSGAAREFRIDFYATRLWLFHDGAEIRKAAQSYVDRLLSSATERS